MKILNAFSLNMLEKEYNQVQCAPILSEEAGSVVQNTLYKGETIENCIGHADLAEVVRGNIGIGGAERKSVTMVKGDTAIVAQYTGPRLPEGAVSLPEGASITYWFVSVN